ncbi:MAG: hypothetical protein WCO96_04460 [Actinomycetes bacterium]
MNARRAYRLTVTKGSPGPAVLAVPGRTDKVELIELASGETVLFWEGSPIEARRLSQTLKQDLRKLEADQFRQAWLAEMTGGSASRG